MVEFETIKGNEINFGENNFIEVGRKKAISEDGENVFLSLSKGFTTPNGNKRYKKNFTFPDNEEVLDQIIEALESLKE
ncbi:MAG: hypothetical protein ABEK36_06065 [Candidatus Aenigmatarchaeota archaeon]